MGYTSPTRLVAAAANGRDNAAGCASPNDFVHITNSYLFNSDDEPVLVVTTIPARW